MFFRSKTGGAAYLIAGLGNPGTKYSGTRHNVGFAAIDALAASLHVRIDRAKFQALTATADIGGQKVLLLKPQTYMNLSGKAVAAAARFYKLPPEHIIVLSDDISLDPGRIRVRKQGSAGGHNGLKSIIECLGSDAFPRVKIGVGAKPHPDYDLADWVLSTFPYREREHMAEVCGHAGEAAACIVTDGPDVAANRFNGG